MPVYNKEDYISEAIDSVLKQKYKNWELIIINDGSNDNSLEICNNYKRIDDRIKVFNQDNLGLSISRNTGIKNSNGDYIIFLDADDYLEYDCLINIVDNISEMKDIYICSFKRIFPNGNIKVFNRFKYLIRNTEGSGQLILKMMYKLNIYESSVWSNIYKKNYIEKNKIYFSENLIHEDEEWLLKILLMAENVEVLNCLLYNTRAGVQNSIINSKNYKKNISKIIISENIMSFIQNVKFEDEELKERIKLAMTSFYIKAILKIDDFEDNEKRKILNTAKKNKHILKNAVSNKQKIAKIILSIFGLNIGCKILNKVVR